MLALGCHLSFFCDFVTVLVHKQFDVKHHVEGLVADFQEYQVIKVFFLKICLQQQLLVYLFLVLTVEEGVNYDRFARVLLFLLFSFDGLLDFSENF